MKKMFVLMLSLVMTTMGFAQKNYSFPTKAVSFSAMGNFGSNRSSFFLGSVEGYSKIADPLYLQTRGGFMFSDGNSQVSLGFVPTVVIKSFKKATTYVGFQLSANQPLQSGAAYLQYAPEAGIIGQLGEKSFVVARLNYNLKDNTNHVVGMAVGIGIKL